MIQELEIKHIMPYILSDLKLQYFGELIGKLSGYMEGAGHYPVRILYNGQDNYNIDATMGSEIFLELKDIKPILHPLYNFGDSDDLRKVHEFIGLGKWCDAYDIYFNIWFDNVANVDKLILQAPYEIAQYFFKNHYDVFGLIPAGLAVDINTLNK
jgi:hypothetical protein